MDTMTKLHSEMGLEPIEENHSMGTTTTHVAKASLVLSMAGQAADGLQRAMANRAHSVRHLLFIFAWTCV